MTRAVSRSSSCSRSGYAPGHPDPDRQLAERRICLFRASPEEFRTGWFIESLLTELVIALVVRTRRVFFRSRLGTLLLASTLTFIGITLVLPYVPFNYLFGFTPLPAPLMLTMLGLTTLYVLVTELTKKYIYSRAGNATD